MLTCVLGGCDDPEGRRVASQGSGEGHRIVGDHDAEPIPYFTMILGQNAKGVYYASGCGASLISNCHVLTAAHCVAGAPPERNAAVYTGAHTPYTGNNGVPFAVRHISDITIHEDYVGATSGHDVALFTLESCIDDAFEPVTLAPPDHPLRDGDLLEVYGFGRLEEDGGDRVDTLQEVTVPMVEHDECRSMVGSNVTLDTICAGYDEGGMDSCQGDSGGPLVDNRNPGAPVQTGIVSWGIGCARPETPGVYASVPAHFEWIKQRVCNDDRVTSALCAPRLADASPGQAQVIAGT